MTCHHRGMNASTRRKLPVDPNDNYLIVTWAELEQSWLLLASPERTAYIKPTLTALQNVNRLEGSDKAIYSLVAATAWLTDDGVSSSGD